MNKCTEYILLSFDLKSLQKYLHSMTYSMKLKGKIYSQRFLIEILYSYEKLVLRKLLILTRMRLNLANPSAEK